MSLPVDEHFKHHCELLPDYESTGDSGEEACMSMYRTCENGHDGLIPVAEFEEHLPLELRTAKIVAITRNHIARTVNIKVPHTSNNRPDKFSDSDSEYPFSDRKGKNDRTRVGTGYIKKGMAPAYSIPCPCPECKGSKVQKKRWEWLVVTATHVVYDTSEAETAVIELFYDSDTKEGVKLLYGSYVYGNKKRRCNSDRCYMFCITHDAALADRLTKICSFVDVIEHKKDTEALMTDCGVPAMLISHPHGVSKKLALGKIYNEFLMPDSDSDVKSVVLPKGCQFWSPPSESQTEDIQHDDHSMEYAHTSREKTEPPQLTTKNLQKIPDEYGEVTAVPPRGAKSHCRLIPSPHVNEMGQFHDGTRFVAESDKEIRNLFPPNTAFVLSIDDVEWKFAYIEHDMASCRGSSGGLIIDLMGTRIRSYFHFGAREDMKKVSGLKCNHHSDCGPYYDVHERHEGNEPYSHTDDEKQAVRAKRIKRTEALRRKCKEKIDNDWFHDRLKKSKHSSIE